MWATNDTKERSKTAPPRRQARTEPPDYGEEKEWANSKQACSSTLDWPWVRETEEIHACTVRPQPTLSESFSWNGSPRGRGDDRDGATRRAYKERLLPSSSLPPTKYEQILCLIWSTVSPVQWHNQSLTVPGEVCRKFNGNSVSSSKNSSNIKGGTIRTCPQF